MSRLASRRPAWLRAALILLALLGAVLAPATLAAPAEAAPAPPAAVSTEPTGEAHQDGADSSLRVPTKRSAPRTAPATGPRNPAPRHPRTPHIHLPLPVPAPRSVVLRC